MGAKSLCIPFDQPKGDGAIIPGTTKCPQCGENAKVCSSPLTSSEKEIYANGANSITLSLEDPTRHGFLYLLSFVFVFFFFLLPLIKRFLAFIGIDWGVF